MCWHSETADDPTEELVTEENGKVSRPTKYSTKRKTLDVHGAYMQYARAVEHAEENSTDQCTQPPN